MMGQEKSRGHSTICENARDVLRAEAMEVGLRELYGQQTSQAVGTQIVSGLAAQGSDRVLRDKVSNVRRNIRTRSMSCPR